MHEKDNYDVSHLHIPSSKTNSTQAVSMLN